MFFLWDIYEQNFEKILTISYDMIKLSVKRVFRATFTEEYNLEHPDDTFL